MAQLKKELSAGRRLRHSPGPDESRHRGYAGNRVDAGIGAGARDHRRPISSFRAAAPR